MKSGTLYGVSVGPGDPELLTLKAVRVLNECNSIAAPQTKGEKTLALDIIKDKVKLDGKEVFNISFLMTRDPEQLCKNYDMVTTEIITRLKSGTDVAMINLGDVSIFSTFSYVSKRVQDMGYAVEIVAGVPSFCAVAAKLKTSLTERDNPLHIIPASAENMAEVLALKGTKVIMKTGKSLKNTLSEIKRANLQNATSMVQNCGLSTERVCKTVDLADDSVDYFTTIIVKE